MPQMFLYNNQKNMHVIHTDTLAWKMKIIAEHFYLETHQHETVLGAWHQSKGGVSLGLRYICSPQAYILKGGGGGMG